METLEPASCVVMLELAPVAGPSPVPFRVMNSLGAIPPAWKVAALNTSTELWRTVICGAVVGAILATKPWKQQVLAPAVVWNAPGVVIRLVPRMLPDRK